MDVAIIITISTVLILFALTVTTRWIVPKSLAEEDHDEEHSDSNSVARSHSHDG